MISSTVSLWLTGTPWMDLRGLSFKGLAAPLPPPPEGASRTAAALGGPPLFLAMLRATPLREKTLYTLTTLRLVVRQAWLEGACLRSLILLCCCGAWEGRMSLG